MKASISTLLLYCIIAASGSAWGQQVVPPGSSIRINPGRTADEPPAQTDPAFKPKERDEAMARKAENGCSCAGNNRCYYSLDFNYCIAPDGERVFIQRFWGH
jgi:hypothetical protein